MTVLLKVTVINTSKHKINEFVIIPLYFFRIIKTNFLVYAYIWQKLHFADSFRINILIGNNLLSPKSISINITLKSAYIKISKITILFDIC